LGGVCRILWDCTGFSGVSVAIEPTGRGIYMEIPSSKLYTVIAMDNGPFIYRYFAYSFQNCDFP
jgi:hypothetical protein